MKHKLKNISLSQEKMLEIIETVDKSLTTTVRSALKDLIDLSKDKTLLSDNIAFNSLKLKSDSHLFKRLLDVVEKYQKILPSLRTAINDNISETITTGTNNVNNRIVISLLSEGIYFAEEVPMLLSNMINKFYTKSGTELDKSISAHLSHRLILLIQIIPEMEKADLDKVVESIGNIPTVSTLKFESSSDIPTEVVMGFFQKTIGIKDFYTQTFLKRMLGYFNFKKEHKKHSNITKNFIGNPIYHLRLFLIDLDSLRLERLKDEKSLLELRILELKSSDTDGKLKKQISYYENKLNKLDMKIRKLSEIH
jgi:hypothetical protein